MRDMPILVKLWFVGFVVIYAAAKIHTFATMDSGRFLEQHWPFWVAMAAWFGVLVIGSGLSDRRKRSSGPPPNGRT
jgi:hypothetical protein